MFKIAAIIGGMMLMAGVAFAGTRTMLEQAGTPTINSTAPLPAASTASPQDDRGRENEARGRADEANEDLRGPCDEAEHANDPRCAVVTPAGTVTTHADDDRSGPNRGHDAGDDHGGNSGPGGGESGHGGHGDDD